MCTISKGVGVIYVCSRHESVDEKQPQKIKINKYIYIRAMRE